MLGRNSTKDGKRHLQVSFVGAAEGVANTMGQSSLPSSTVPENAFMPEKERWDEEAIEELCKQPGVIGVTGIAAIQEYRPYSLAGHTACWKAAKLKMWEQVKILLDQTFFSL